MLDFWHSISGKLTVLALAIHLTFSNSLINFHSQEAQGEEGTAVIINFCTVNKLNIAYSPNNICFKDIVTFIAFEDYQYFVLYIFDSLGISIENFFIPVRNAAIDNAAAMKYEGVDIIIYDRRISTLVGMEGAIAILAHEIGHIICHHFGSGRTDYYRMESDSDYFAGAALRKMSFGKQSIESIRPILSSQGSTTHPPLDQRLAAIHVGYMNPEIIWSCQK